MDSENEAAVNGMFKLKKRLLFVETQLFTEYAYVGQKMILALLPGMEQWHRLSKRSWERRARVARQVLKKIAEFLNAPSLRHCLV